MMACLVVPFHSGKQMVLQNEVLFSLHFIGKLMTFFPIKCLSVSLSWDEKEAGLDVVLEPPVGVNVLKSFKVYVKTLRGTTVTLEDVNASTTIAEVKKKMQDHNCGPDTTDCL